MRKAIALIIAAAMVCGIIVYESKHMQVVDSSATSGASEITATTSEKEEISEQSTTEETTLTTTENSITSTTTASATVSTVNTTTTTTAATKKSQATTLKSGEKRDIEKFKGKKLLAITFDDGPYTPVTTSLLERLDKYDARVTFFVLGSRLDGSKSYRDTMKKAYEMGNQIASHTYSHSDLTTLSEEALKKEIEKTNASVKNVIGIEPDAIRPPYGSINSKVQKAMNKHIIIWSIDTLDWKCRNADTVCNNIVNNAFDGGIVLLHDLYQTSVDGAIKAMEKLSQKGYAFVTVDEMAQLRGVEMDTNTKYYQFKPAK